MSFIKQWCLCVCISLVCAVILSLFAPKGNMNRFYKTLISFFVFISFVYPLKGLDLNALRLPEEESFITSAENDKLYEKTVNEQVKSVLRQNGIDGASVSSDLSVNYETGEITVERVRIAVGDGYDRTAVKNTVFEALGIQAEVYGIGE